ncbi:MAG TPA: hypothetical protein VK620_03435 [Bradyrhizobium sp.]|nr:hypothetical protein [Bradyrhizobium sp.]
MIASVSCRNPFCALGSLQFGNWAQGTSDRGGQDKARKVRAVGRLEDGSNFNQAPNIAKIQRTLPFSTTLYRTTTFDTL